MGEQQTPTATQSEQKAFEFPGGLFGFPHVKRYVISEIPGGGDIFKQMVALDHPNLGFTLVYPNAFFPEYAPDIPDEDLREIGVETPDQAVIMVIANIPAQFKDAMANLKAPVVFNPYTLKARQVILQDEGYTTRHRLFPG